MAFVSTLVLNDGLATPVARSFTLTQTLSNATLRLDTSSTAQLPRTMRISHNTGRINGKSGAILDVRSLTFATMFADPNDSTRPFALTTSLTHRIPRVAALLQQYVSDHNAFVRNAMATSGFMDQFQRGES